MLYKSIASAVTKDSLYLTDDMGGASEEMGWCGVRVVEEEGDEGSVEDDDMKRGCLAFHLRGVSPQRVARVATYLAHPPASPPRPAPIHGLPTPMMPLVHVISNGVLTPR